MNKGLSDYKIKKAKVRQEHLEMATGDMVVHREQAKKDLAKRDLQLDSEDSYDSDHSFG